jgi:hypothetical protein
MCSVQWNAIEMYVKTTRIMFCLTTFKGSAMRKKKADTVMHGCRRNLNIVWLIVYHFRSRSWILHFYGDVTIASEGLQNLGLHLALTLGLWAGRDLYCATSAVTWGLSVCGLIRRITPFSCLLRNARGAAPLLNQILKTWFNAHYCTSNRKMESLLHIFN